MIRNIAHRVDCFVGGAGGNDDALPRERLGREERVGELADFSGLHHAPGSLVAAGLKAFDGAEKRCAVELQVLYVALQGGIRPHRLIHGGHKGDRRASRGNERAREVVGDAVCRLGNQVRGGGHHEKEVRRAGKLNMGHHGIGVLRPFSRECGLSRERFEGEGRHEFCGVLGEDDLNFGACLHQKARCLAALEGGNAARNDKRDEFALEHEFP